MYYWIIVNNSTNEFGSGSGTHPPDESLAPNGFDFVDLGQTLDVTAQAAFNNPQAYLYQNGAFVVNPNYDANAVALSNAKTTQLAQLNSGLQATLNGGFTAKTLVGTATSPHKYPTDDGAQRNFTGAVTSFTVNPNKTSVTVQTLDAGWVSHTKSEFYGVYSDGDAWKEAQYAQFTTLEAKVIQLASTPGTSVEQIQAVVWSEAPY